MATTADHLRTTLDGRWREVRERVRGELNDERFAPHYTPNTAIARSKALEQMRVLADLGYAANGFAVSHGGTGDAGGAVTSIEMLAMSDLSLMVKAGVQWGLFGGAIENLGTERHHQAYVKPLIDLDLLGCFAMTETGHGSDVQELETTATYDVETGRVRRQLPHSVLSQGLHRRRCPARHRRSGVRTADHRRRKSGRPLLCRADS